jgi:hypothetical protein
MNCAFFLQNLDRSCALINRVPPSGGRGDLETGRGAFADSNQLPYEIFQSGGLRPA